MKYALTAAVVVLTQQLALSARQRVEGQHFVRAPVLRYTDRWKLRPGTTMIRVIVRDRSSGRYGTLDVPVKHIPAVKG
jgi:hypothetical protein